MTSSSLSSIGGTTAELPPPRERVRCRARVEDLCDAAGAVKLTRQCWRARHTGHETLLDRTLGTVRHGHCGRVVAEAVGAAVIVPVHGLSMDSGDGRTLFVIVSALGLLVGFGWPSMLSRAWRFYDRQGDLSERDPLLASAHAAALAEASATYLRPLVGSQDLPPGLRDAAANAHQGLTSLRQEAHVNEPSLRVGS
jgi:hypothetical protein